MNLRSLLRPSVLVVVVAAVVSLPHWFEPVRWNDPDSLFYEAKVFAIRGEDEKTAVHRVFTSPIAGHLLRAELHSPPARRRYVSTSWIDYNNRSFYHRRWVVSLMAAGVYPVFGERSLLTVSLLGYLLLSLALYALLRRRFTPTISAAVTVVCLLAPPLRAASFAPMTDSWGILLETCALLAAVLTFDRGTGWVAAWVAAIAVLSFTRDDTVVPLVAVLGLVLLHRNRRRSALLAGTGIAALLPGALLLGSASVRQNLAFNFSSYWPPKNDSWDFVLNGYWPHLRHLIRADLDYGTSLGWQAPLWYIGLALVAVGVVLLITRSVRSPDLFFPLHCYALVGAAVFVAFADDYTGFRDELTSLPAVAVALALLADTAWRWYAARARARRPEPVTAGRRNVLARG
jgi:hypothetical protein